MGIIDFLPSVSSISGLVFYAVLAYIFSFIMSRLTSAFVARNLDIEEAVKRNIIQERQKKQERGALIQKVINATKNQSVLTK